MALFLGPVFYHPESNAVAGITFEMDDLQGHLVGVTRAIRIAYFL